MTPEKDQYGTPTGKWKARIGTCKGKTKKKKKKKKFEHSIKMNGQKKISK